jgi:hypothetical protein
MYLVCCSPTLFSPQNTTSDNLGILGKCLVSYASHLFARALDVTAHREKKPTPLSPRLTQLIGMSEDKEIVFVASPATEKPKTVDVGADGFVVHFWHKLSSNCLRYPTLNRRFYCAKTQPHCHNNNFFSTIIWTLPMTAFGLHCWLHPH